MVFVVIFQCFTALSLLTVNWIAHVAVSYPPMTKEEFKTYVFDYFRAEGSLPVFMEFFQFKIVSSRTVWL